MRILVLWGKDEKLMNEILPREFTHSKCMSLKRLNWVLNKIKEQSK